MKQGAIFKDTGQELSSWKVDFISKKRKAKVSTFVEHDITSGDNFRKVHVDMKGEKEVYILNLGRDSKYDGKIVCLDFSFDARIFSSLKSDRCDDINGITCSLLVHQGDFFFSSPFANIYEDNWRTFMGTNLESHNFKRIELQQLVGYNNMRVDSLHPDFSGFGSKPLKFGLCIRVISNNKSIDSKSSTTFTSSQSIGLRNFCVTLQQRSSPTILIEKVKSSSSSISNSNIEPKPYIECIKAAKAHVTLVDTLKSRLEREIIERKLIEKQLEETCKKLSNVEETSKEQLSKLSKQFLDDKDYTKREQTKLVKKLEQHKKMNIQFETKITQNENIREKLEKEINYLKDNTLKLDDQYKTNLIKEKNKTKVAKTKLKSMKDTLCIVKEDKVNLLKKLKLQEERNIQLEYDIKCLKEEIETFIHIKDVVNVKLEEDLQLAIENQEVLQKHLKSQENLFSKLEKESSQTNETQKQQLVLLEQSYYELDNNLYQLQKDKESIETLLTSRDNYCENLENEFKEIKDKKVELEETNTLLQEEIYNIKEELNKSMKITDDTNIKLKQDLEQTKQSHKELEKLLEYHKKNNEVMLRKLEEAQHNQKKLKEEIAREAKLVHDSTSLQKTIQEKLSEALSDNNILKFEIIKSEEKQLELSTKLIEEQKQNKAAHRELTNIQTHSEYQEALYEQTLVNLKLKSEELADRNKEIQELEEKLASLRVKASTSSPLHSVIMDQLYTERAAKERAESTLQQFMELLGSTTTRMGSPLSEE